MQGEGQRDVTGSRKVILLSLEPRLSPASLTVGTVCSANGLTTSTYVSWVFSARPRSFLSSTVRCLRRVKILYLLYNGRPDVTEDCGQQTLTTNAWREARGRAVVGHSCAKPLVQQWLCDSRPRAGPAQPRGFSESKTGQSPSIGEKAVPLSVSELRREIALSEAVGSAQELLAAGQQLIGKALNLLPMVGGIGSSRTWSRRNVNDWSTTDGRRVCHIDAKQL